jgi:hypothetical protein
MRRRRGHAGHFVACCSDLVGDSERKPFGQSARSAY